MRIVLIGAGVAVIAALVVFLQSAGAPPGDLWAAMQSWPVAQQAAIAVIAAAFIFVLAAALRQADRIEQQARAVDILQKRMNGIRDEVAGAADSQAGADAAVRHLVGVDPVATIDEVQKRLAEAETRATEQAAQNEAIDLQTRLDEIRKRQQALRTQLGSISEKRRTIEPVLGEVRERQAQLERSLGDLEKDDSGKAIATRLEEAESFLNRGHTRLDALEKALDDLKGAGVELEKLQQQLAPLKHAESGVKTLLGSVMSLQKRVDDALVSLEKEDDVAISERIERLSKAKAEIEQRIAALTSSFGSLEAMRGDIGSQFEKLQAALDGHVKRPG